MTSPKNPSNLKGFWTIVALVLLVPPGLTATFVWLNNGNWDIFAYACGGITIAVYTLFVFILFIVLRSDIQPSMDLDG